MWLDDDGDEPIGGEIPDPSTRQWRHPSEIAAEAARAAAASPLVPEGAMAGAGQPVSLGSSASILWPITVVGGCIAIAALGIFGLYLTGAAPQNELQAASATTVNSGNAGLSSLSRQSSSPESRASDEAAASSENLDADEEAPLRSLDNDRAPLTTTTTSAPAESSSTTSTTSTSSTLVKPPTAIPKASLVGPAVYPAGGLRGEHLASFVLVDGYLLTSASALTGHTEVTLKIGYLSVDAVVSHIDPLSDIAILTTVEALTDLNMPVAIVGSEVEPGVAVYLGYCPGELKLESPDLAREQPTESLAVGPAAGLGCLPTLAAAELVDDAAAPEGEITPPELEDGEPYDNAEQAPPDTAAVPDAFEREGKVYSLDQTLLTLADHWLYYPIRTGIPQNTKVAGSPLRNADGELVGIVVAGVSPNVSALPIDRALNIAESLVTTGLGSPAWLGIDVRSTSSGVEVLAISEGGPSYGLLEVGDLIDRAAGHELKEPDHLEYLARNLGPDNELRLRITRSGDRSWVTIVIGTAPTE